MREPKDTNIFKLSIHKNSFTTNINDPEPNKILRIKTNDDVKLFTKLYRMKPYKKLSLLDSKKMFILAKSYKKIWWN